MSIANSIPTVVSSMPVWGIPKSSSTKSGERYDILLSFIKFSDVLAFQWHLKFSFQYCAQEYLQGQTQLNMLNIQTRYDWPICENRYSLINCIFWCTFNTLQKPGRCAVIYLCVWRPGKCASYICVYGDQESVRSYICVYGGQESVRSYICVYGGQESVRSYICVSVTRHM